MDFKLEKLLEGIYQDFYFWLETYLPKILWAILIIWIWLVLALSIYKVIIFLFNKFKILELIDKLDIDFSKKKNIKSENNEIIDKSIKKKQIKLSEKIAEKIKIDDIVAKAISYYIFLIFFRLSIVAIWIKEIENFLQQLISYLPNLFVWFLIGFFWIRFANFIYDLIYHTLNITWQKTSRIIASWGQIIILFFTSMAMLNKVWIATEIINIILIWFISMLSIAWWLAFWLWWKDIAKEIIESFRK